ncbi:MAG: NADH-quinone oxidoreductase subunit H [Alistipes sp.]|nr:NADH-quinone oxidoreductase subunit H [Alistipes sp.]
MGIALNTLLMLIVAVSITGVINRTRALLAGRKGLPFLQHIYNARLMLRKGAVYSTTTTALFKIAPAVYLGAAIVAMLFIPVADLYPLISFEGDVICFAYLLALGRVALILAAMDTGSSFEGMGASREALYGALIEPAMMIGFATLAMFCGYTSFADIFAHEQSLNIHLTIVMLLTAYLFIKITFVESGRVPVDDPRTHLELTMIHEVMCLDYCGVDMAMIQIAGWLKTASLSMLAANAIAATGCFHWWLATPLAILLTGVSVGVVESTQARNKLLRNTTFIVTISALAALIFFIGFLLQLNINI